MQAIHTACLTQEELQALVNALLELEIRVGLYSMRIVTPFW